MEGKGETPPGDPTPLRSNRQVQNRLDRPAVCRVGQSPAQPEVEDPRFAVDIQRYEQTVVLLPPRQRAGERARRGVKLAAQRKALADAACRL